MNHENYKKALQADKAQTIEYYNKSLLQKSEQQKFLEKLLRQNDGQFGQIADIACGGGTLTYHLSKQYPEAVFSLLDYNEDAIELAKKNNSDSRFSFYRDSIYDMQSLADNTFDLVCCWQTLSWLDEPEKAMKELVRITKTGGKIFVSSLFNADKDVDLYTKVFDHTRKSGAQGMAFSYNTYSRFTIGRWLQGIARNFELVPFDPVIDFEFSGKGIGTFTIKTLENRRLQVSAGMLLNWAVLIIEK